MPTDGIIISREQLSQLTTWEFKEFIRKLEEKWKPKPTPTPATVCAKGE